MSKLPLKASLAFVIAAGAVQPLAGEAAAKPHTSLSTPAKRGLAFALQRCSGCHGVVENRSSPNPESPPFEDIANRPNVTQATLRQFLRDSHNYPAAMNFSVESARIRDLAAYIVTLKKPGYRPLVN